MSNVWGWFGGGAAQKKKDTPKNAILGLRSQLEMLQKREGHLQTQIDQQDALARKNVTTNKSGKFSAPYVAGRHTPRRHVDANTSSPLAAAKAALRRKKAHEHSLEQTQAQIGTLEQQVNAIESANINRETLAAMERAATAMKQIHGGLTPEKVDETMERIQEQNQLSEEIVNAITSNQIGEAVDDADLEEELDKLQQEQLDEKMLDTSVPVSDAVHRLPAAANGERKYPYMNKTDLFVLPLTV